MAHRQVRVVRNPIRYGQSAILPGQIIGKNRAAFIANGIIGATLLGTTHREVTERPDLILLLLLLHVNPLTLRAAKTGLTILEIFF